MILCNKCGSDDWEIVRRSPIDPAEDTFRCNRCGNVWRRYDPPKEDKPK